MGPQSQQGVIDQYRAADLFVLNSRIDGDGDRDGLPNVLVEAQSQGLAVVATAISGIPELVEHHQTGVLFTPSDWDQLAEYHVDSWIDHTQPPGMNDLNALKGIARLSDCAGNYLAQDFTCGNDAMMTRCSHSVSQRLSVTRNILHDMYVVY